jgi:hypothetical protein
MIQLAVQGDPAAVQSTCGYPAAVPRVSIGGVITIDPRGARRARRPLPAGVATTGGNDEP